MIENDSEVIVKGRIYELVESGYTVLGGEVRLDAVDDGSWLEITKEDLEECFESMEVRTNESNI